MPNKYCSAFDSYCKHRSEGKCTKEQLGKNGNPCTFMVQVSDPVQQLNIKYLHTIVMQNTQILQQLTGRKK